MLLLLLACQNQSRRKLVEQAPLISQTYTDHTGRTIRLPRSPQRVISIAPNISEIIYAIGAAHKLVARSQACDYPPQIAEKPVVTTYPQINLEELLLYEPELVIGTDEIFAPEAIAQLDKLGLPVYIQHYEHFEDIYQGIRELGNILECSQRAAQLADSLQQLEARITSKTQNEAKYGCMILVSIDPLIVVGGGGFLHQMIEKAGGRNVFEQVEKAYHTSTVEEIIRLQPEYLILPTEDEQVYGRLLAQYPYLQNMPAAVNQQVYRVDPDLMYRPGPRVLRGLLELTHILHSSLNPRQFLEEGSQTP